MLLRDSPSWTFFFPFCSAWRNRARYGALAALPSFDGALAALPYHGEPPALPSRDGALGGLPFELGIALSLFVFVSSIRWCWSSNKKWSTMAVLKKKSQEKKFFSQLSFLTKLRYDNFIRFFCFNINDLINFNLEYILI